MAKFANAIPPNVGDTAAANDSIPKVPNSLGAGTAHTTGANACNFAGQAEIGIRNSMQGVDNIPRPDQGPRINPSVENHGNQGVHYRFPGPPGTLAGQTINTGVSIAALAFICLQGYWGILCLCVGYGT